MTGKAGLSALAFAVPACLLLFPLPGRAFLSTAGQVHSLHLGGSLRTVAAAIDNYGEPLLFGNDNPMDGFRRRSSD